MPQPKPLEREALENALGKLVQPYSDKLLRVAQNALQGVVVDEPNPNGIPLITALADFVAERDKQRIAEIRKWVAYNKHDMGELGEFIRTQYVYNKLDELEGRGDATGLVSFDGESTPIAQVGKTDEIDYGGGNRG